MPLKDIIDLLGTINSIKRSQEAQALAEQNARVGAYGQFGQLLSHQTNTQDMVPLIHSFSESSGINEEALRDIAAHYQPPSSDISASLFGQYVKGNVDPTLQRETAYAQGTGQSAGAGARSGAQQGAFGSMDEAMRRQFNSQTVAGMSTGQAAMDQSLAAMPADQLAHGNAIKLGLAPAAGDILHEQGVTAGQRLQGTIAGEDLNYKDRALAQEGVLGLMHVNAARDTGTGTAIKEARDRYQKNLEAITTKPTNKAGQYQILENMREDYDFLHGQGSFHQTFPEAYGTDLNPSLAIRIFNRISP